MRIGKNCNISPRASFYNEEAVELGDNVRIDDFAVISGGKGIKIGSCVHISAHCSLFGGGEIILNDFVTLAPCVQLFSQSDDYSGRSIAGPHVPMEYKPYFSSGRILLRRHVLVGCHSVIMPGVDVGIGTSFGAFSFVTGDCQEWSIYAGIPAKRIGDRSNEIMQLEKKWHDTLIS